MATCHKYSLLTAHLKKKDNIFFLAIECHQYQVMFYKDKSLNDVWKKNGNINSYQGAEEKTKQNKEQKKKLQTRTNSIPISIKYETSMHPFFDSWSTVFHEDDDDDDDIHIRYPAECLFDKRKKIPHTHAYSHTPERVESKENTKQNHIHTWLTAYQGLLIAHKTLKELQNGSKHWQEVPSTHRRRLGREGVRLRCRWKYGWLQVVNFCFSCCCSLE